MQSGKVGGKNLVMDIRNHRVLTQFVLTVYIQFLLFHFSQQESIKSAKDIPRYSFKEYSYVALPKYETYFQEFQSACKQNPSCQLLEGVDRLNCIRECISPSCYIELYQGDKRLVKSMFDSSPLKAALSNAEYDEVNKSRCRRPKTQLDIQHSGL